MAIPLIFAAITPFVAWKKANLRTAIRSLTPALLAVFAVIILMLAFFNSKIIAGIMGFGLAVWLGVGSISWLVNSGGKRGKYSVFLGHIGAAIMVAGITASTAYKSETEGLLSPNQSLKIAGYEVILEKISDENNDNYLAKRAELLVKNSSEKEITTLQPEYRTYKIRGSNTSETAIYSNIYGDLYSAIGETKDGKTAIRLYFKPMIYLLWLGFMIISASGIISIIKKRE
jgi:cytochrome c-type biogenesis protein CcmF